jgi:hypothetical protein
MFQYSDADMAFAVWPPARHSQNSRNPFHAGDAFRGFTGSLPLRPAKLLATLHGSDWDAPALGDFYNQAFNGSALPVAGYNYNSGWISFCWRDLHPLEWQLASLHGQTRAIARNLVQRVNVEIMLNSKLRRESDFVGAIGL